MIMKDSRVQMAVAIALTAVACFADEAPFAFRARYDQVHEPGLRDASRVRATDEFAFADGMSVGDADFADFLKVSMGVTCAVDGKPAVQTTLGKVEKGYEIDVDASGVRISAADERMLHQAYYHLEDLMGLRRAPFLKFGCEKRAPRFAPRITHSGWGFDEFSDDYLRRIAHYGFDAIMFYVWGDEEPRATEVRDLIRRARERGLDSYLYSRINTKAFVHPDDPKAEAVFDATYGKLAAAFPEAKGVFFVGESLEFPSKDERSCGLAIDYARDLRKPGDTRPYVGWFPCRDYPQLMEAVKRSLHKVNPKLEVVLWSYNWGYCEEQPRRELVAHLPKDVSLLVTYEMFEEYLLRNGLPVKIADYSLAFEGPGKYFVSEADEAHKNGVRLYAMANTACRTWDLGQVPYLPTPYQWKRRWDGMIAAQEKWGLSGLVEGHHFGWAPNFVSELCKEAFTEGGMDFDTHLRLIAARDFGEANVEAALKAWRNWSEALRDTNPSSANQCGPYRYGPSYPFNALRPNVKGTDFSYSPMFISPNYRSNGGSADHTDDYLVRESALLDTVVARYLDGAAAFRRMGGEKALAMSRLGEYMGRCYLTAANVKRGLVAERAKDEKAVMELARKEYENVKAARELVRADSSLGYEPRLGYRGDARSLELKMKWMERHYFGGEKTAAEPYPELDVTLRGDTLEIANRSPRDFESGGLIVVRRSADGTKLGEDRLQSPALARGKSARIRLPFDPKTVPGLARLDLAFEQFEYGTVISRTVEVPCLTAGVRPVPRPAQLRRIADGFECYGIVHWGLNVYTDREWGFGDENPSDLNPAAFDADQIVGACKAGGLQGIIIVAKHHDGFCLWPTKTTAHNISKSPFRGGKGDYVKEMEQACRRHGLKFGVYVSPWDRNNAHYGTDTYVTDVFQAQIRELLSGAYGEIFEMWFDGANGGDGYYGGAREKRKIPLGYYRYETETFAMVRALQPNVCIFNESDLADYRFGGNERGEVDPDSRATAGHYDHVWANYKKWANTGMTEGVAFKPVEADFPLRPGWFYHASEKGRTKSAAYLMNRYLSAVGNAATLNIGISPNREGRLDDEDVRALKGFGDLQKMFFSKTGDDKDRCNVVVMQEDVSQGEQVDGWKLTADGKTVASGKSIGIKRIRVLDTPVAKSSLRLDVTCGRPAGTGVGVRFHFIDPELLKLVLSATTESGETDTARWMAAGVQTESGNGGVKVRAD